jgi:hypothetical protein
MAFSLREALRWIHGGASKPKPVFNSEKEAYDFCRSLYKSSGGVTPELRRAYEFYIRNYNDECGEFYGPEPRENFTAHAKG